MILPSMIAGMAALTASQGALTVAQSRRRNRTIQVTNEVRSIQGVRTISQTSGICLDGETDAAAIDIRDPW